MEKHKFPFDLFATDLDGTLTNSKKEVTDRTATAIKAAWERGMKVVLASGRPYAGCLPVAERLGLCESGGYILAFNGGQIIDCKTGETVYSKDVAADFLPEIFEAARRFGVTALTYDGPVVLAENAEDEYVQKECFINKITARQVDSLTDTVTWAVPKCMCVGEHEKLLPVKDYLEEKFGDRLSIYFSESFFLEIMAAGVDKAQSLDMLVQRLGSSQEKVIAFGDGMNDISLIRYAGHGVAMANGCEAAKQAADEIAASNEEDGVAQVLERFLALRAD